MAKLPETKVEVSTYDKNDVKKIASLFPTPIQKLKLLTECGFNIGSAHEVMITCANDSLLKMKKLSSDPEYGSCKISTSWLPRKMGKKKVVSVEDVDQSDKEDSDKEVSLLINFS